MVGFYSNNYVNNINFKASISDKEIDSLKDAKQHFSDCYLMTTLETLSHTENGRKILKEQIQHDNNEPNRINCYFYNKFGEKEIYSTPVNIVTKEYKKVYEKQPNEIVRSVDISVNEYEKKHKSKPIYSKIGDNLKDYVFEYNLPSNFMKMLTGIKPHTIGETDLNLDLTPYKTEVMELFSRMDKEKNHSFVISTGIKSLDGHRWHVYIIENVDLSNNTITVKEKRENRPQTMSIDEALKTFKFITGYFNSDLKQS